ncbi:MAG TPA: hypothetical protein VK469_20550, partial [Candidatus Kapabacteria bacterium]|nr:hypothetical protein [Candidatus Kapabacteria bacterium]
MAEEEKKDVEIKPMIEEDHESLLIELKERARYIEIHKRKKFENQLLQLAKTSTNYSKRNYIYEVLVSLQAIWNQNQPVKELQKKFEAAFQEGNHKEAEEYYKKLVKQGLDYIRTFQTGAGEIIPLDIEENTMLLHYDKKELTFYTLQLEQLEKISLPESLAIIHVYVETETGKIENSIRKMWILLEDKDGKKIIISTSLENINAIKLEFQRMEDRAISLCEKLNDVHRLSCFQNQLLLMEKKAIYYRDTNEKWQKLYTTKTKITAFESTRMGFWVGHSNGSVIILKKLQHVRNRDAFKGFTDTIKGIRGTNKYVTIFSKNSLKISDFTGNPVSIPLYTRCEIMQATIFNDAQLLHLANGMLVARDLNQGNILWQMNLGISFDYLFVKQPYVYCVKKNGTIMLFEIPRINSMANDLESKNIHVEKTSFDIEPTFPIRNISNFIGRQEILNEIKEISNAHFLIHSEPRMGKTSLLNVLRDV